MQSGTEDCGVASTAHSDAFRKAHVQDEEHLGRSVELPDFAPTEWSLLPRLYDTICEVCDRPHLVLFATSADMKLPLYVSPVLGLSLAPGSHW